jgi:hypothetical protein
VLPFVAVADKATAASLTQYATGLGADGAAGFGLTVILNPDCAEQPLLVADTTMLATIGEFVVLIAVNDAMLPDPEAGKPMAGLLFVQVMLAPGVVLVNENGPAISPEQKGGGEDGTLISAPGLMMNWRVAVAVPHSFVTVNETVCVPAPVKLMQPGLALFEEPAAPPSNNHA